jgi:hypothetical protein
MHSHHYLALITKLAEDLADINGTKLLAEVVEDSMKAIFDDYIKKNGLISPMDKCNVGREYYSAFGLGKMVVTGNESGGEVRLVHSHIDEGWVMKWGNNDKPINHFTCGFIAAVFASAFDKPARSYTVTETTSMASGASEGKFVVKLS